MPNDSDARFSAIRSNDTGAFRALNDRVDAMDTKIDRIGEAVSDLRESGARIEGALKSAADSMVTHARDDDREFSRVREAHVELRAEVKQQAAELDKLRNWKSFVLGVAALGSAFAVLVWELILKPAIHR